MTVIDGLLFMWLLMLTLYLASLSQWVVKVTKRINELWLRANSNYKE